MSSEVGSVAVMIRRTFKRLVKLSLLAGVVAAVANVVKARREEAATPAWKPATTSPAPADPTPATATR